MVLPLLFAFLQSPDQLTVFAFRSFCMISAWSCSQKNELKEGDNKRSYRETLSSRGRGEEGEMVWFGRVDERRIVRGFVEIRKDAGFLSA